MKEFQPWLDHNKHQEAVRHREMCLPPEYRMAGNKRLLRDALLATMLLGPEFAPRTGDVGTLVTRENKRIEMVARVCALKTKMTPEQIKTATDVAKDLFSAEILKAKRAQLGDKPQPRFKRKRTR